MSQKITYAHIENYKGISSVKIDDLSRFVVIFGNNGAGKTSFLEAIKNAIKLEKGGNKKVKIGETQGMIEIHFEDFKIKRLIGEKTKLEVEHNGELVARPQEWLDSIFMGAIGDPQKFLDLHNKDKIKYILETQGKATLYDELETRRGKAFAERADLHKTVLAKEEEGRLQEEELQKFEGIVPMVNVDMTQLQAELDAVNAYNAEAIEIKNRIQKGDMLITQANKDIDDTQNAIDYNLEGIKELEHKLLKLKEDNVNLDKQKQEKQSELTKLQSFKKSLQDELDRFEMKDPQLIKDKINSYGQVQQEFANYNAKVQMCEKINNDAKVLREKRKELDNQVKIIDQKQNMLIEGLDLTYKMKLEDGVMYVLQDEDYIPLDELNTATQLDIGIDICLSGPNKIKILTIENANALDPKTLEKVKEKILKNDAQCFLETVYHTAYESITIENGTIN